LFINWFTGSFLALIFWIILGKTLNPSSVGVVSTLNNFVIIVSSLSTLGIVRALNKLIPEINKKEGVRSVYSLINLSLKPILISLMSIFFVFLIFSNQISSFLKVPYYAFLISIFSLMALSIWDFLLTVPYGLQNMKRMFISDFFQMSIRLLLTGVLIFFGLSYFGPLTAFFMGYLISSLYLFNINYIKKTESTFTYKQLFDYAFPALLAFFATSLVTNGQYIILTILKNTEVTGIFTIASTITSVIAMITHTLVTALFPIISSLSVDKKRKKRRGYLIGLVLRYSLFLTIPISVFTIIFAKHAIIFFSKTAFLPAEKYFLILVPASIFYGIGTLFLLNIYAVGKPKLYRNINLIIAFCFLILSLILINYFSALGLSISFFIVMLLRFLLSLSSLKKYIKIDLFIKDISKVLFSSLIIMSILYFMKPFINNIILLVMILIPISLLYLLLLLYTKFYRPEDIKILRYFGKRIPIVGNYISSIADFVENFRKHFNN